MTPQIPTIDSPAYGLPRVHEVIVTWMLVLLACHFLVGITLPEIENADYLKWPLSTIVMLLIFKAVLRRSARELRSVLGESLTSSVMPELLKVFILVLLIGLGMWGLWIYIISQFNMRAAIDAYGLIPAGDFSAIRWSVPWVFASLLAGAVFVPITEELVFRGFIINRLLYSMSPFKAALWSSFIFACFHIDKNFIASFFHGLLFATALFRFRSLYAPILLHGLYNAVVTFLRLVFGFSLSADLAQINQLSYWMPSVASALVGIIWLVAYCAMAYGSKNG